MKEQPSGNERLVKIAPMSRERWSREFHDPSLFYNFECKEEQLDLVDEVAVRQGKTVVLISYETGMPSNATPQEQRGHTLLAHFMRIDLRSKPGMPELDPTGSSATIPQFERKAISNAYYRWILSGCSRDEQLVLAHLAIEGLVNPRNEKVIEELLAKRLIAVKGGLLSVSDGGFEDFLKHDTELAGAVGEWERAGVTVPWGPIRATLILLGLGVVAFLSTQGEEVLQTWVTYLTGIAGSVLGLIQLFGRQTGASEPRSQTLPS